MVNSCWCHRWHDAMQLSVFSITDPTASQFGCLLQSQVSRRGEELLKKRCGVDAHRPPGERRGRGFAARVGVCRWSDVQNDATQMFLAR